MAHVFIFLFLLLPLRVHDLFYDDNVVGVPVFVKKGDSVTLHTDTSDQQEIRRFNFITWRFNYNNIAEIDVNYSISEDHGRICTDVQCDDGNEKFRDRLKLDNQTGSLTIRDIRTTDSGLYYLDGFDFKRLDKIFIVAVHGVFGVGSEGRSVFVMEGDSVTLNTGVETNQEEEIRWYFNKNLIAEINRDLSKICTDVQCKDGDERFRDRLRVDNQTGSLTITNIRTTDSGLYTPQITHSSSSQWDFGVAVHDVPAAERDQMKTKSVKEGESFFLDPDPVLKNPNDLMTWYFNDIPIAEITEDQSRICTDVQCKDGDERFRDRLKVDHQTGSLTMNNTRTKDSGVYKLKIISSSSSIIRSFSVTVICLFGIGADGKTVSVMEGDSVTLHTGVDQQEDIVIDSIHWFFNNTRIARIIEDHIWICTNDQCDGRFGDRLKLNYLTGSLTITNTRTTDSGDYKLRIFTFNQGFGLTKITSATVHGDPDAQRDEMKKKSVKEGESVTLGPGDIQTPNYVMTWYFDDTVIAEITGDQSNICTDDYCEERFSNRLWLNTQTGSLTITNITITDSGLYKLQINSSRISIIRNFRVTVVVPDSSLSSAALVGICAGVVGVLLLIVAVLIYCFKCRTGIRRHHCDQANGIEDSSPNQKDTLLMDTISDSSPNQTETKVADETPT